jgi:hypothetical protein
MQPAAPQTISFIAEHLFLQYGLGLAEGIPSFARKPLERGKQQKSCTNCSILLGSIVLGRVFEHVRTFTAQCYEIIADSGLLSFF